jgi:hypothetical protein
MAYIKLNSDTLNNSSNNMKIIDEAIMQGVNKQRQEMMRNALLNSIGIDNYIIPDNTQKPLDYLSYNQQPIPDTITPYNIGEEVIPNSNPNSSKISLSDLLNNINLDSYVIPDNTQQPINYMMQQPKEQPKEQPKKRVVKKNTSEESKPIQGVKKEIEKKKKELSILELLQKGFTDAFRDPITSTGETSNIYDMLRGATSVMAPNQSAIMENEIQGLKDKESARLAVESQQAKQEQEFEQKLYLETLKNKLKEQENMTTSDKRFANTIIESTLKDKFVEGYKDALKEANYIKTVINSGSSYSLDTIITKLVRMSGDPRVSDQDRQAYQNALGFFQGLNQKTRKMIAGGKLTKGSPAYKAIMSMTNELANVSSNGLRNSLASTEERLASYGYKHDWASELMNSYYNQYGIKGEEQKQYKSNIITSTGKTFKTSSGNSFKIIKSEDI